MQPPAGDCASACEDAETEYMMTDPESESAMKKQKSETKQILPDGSRLQAAALPYRRAKDLEVLLVSSLDTGRWIVPKGWPMKGRKNFETAKREAYEEAGVRAKSRPRPKDRSIITSASAMAPSGDAWSRFFRSK